MHPRLGLRSRILALTMPIVVLVSAATAAVIYLSLGQVLGLCREPVLHALRLFERAMDEPCDVLWGQPSGLEALALGLLHQPTPELLRQGGRDIHSAVVGALGHVRDEPALALPANALLPDAPENP